MAPDVDNEWQTLSLRCVVSQKLLTDPARFRDCKHPDRFNYEDLREFAAKTPGAGGPRNKCPVTGCNAPFRVNLLERDEWLCQELVPHLEEARADEASFMANLVAEVRYEKELRVYKKELGGRAGSKRKRDDAEDDAGGAMQQPVKEEPP